MAEDRILKPVAISGFPEWLPQVRLVEQQWLDRIRAAYERYGFCSVETPSVEALEVLMSKGETSQEVYTLSRLQADPSAANEARLGLHFDLTVPLARYVAQHFNDLVFPFKRYQIQRVWRGERPQEGRFREFTQCDIDVIGQDSLPLSFDAELPRIIHEVLTDLLPDDGGNGEVGGFTLGINNRKVLQGFYEGIGISDPVGVIRIADKLAKIGPDATGQLLTGELGLTDTQVKAVLDLAQVRGGAGVVDEIARIGSGGPLLDEGLAELGFVLSELADLAEGSVVADLSIARGLDYYTGTVYEGTLNNAPGFGSICSGGRYDDLAGSFIRRHLPGIGMSIGLTRIFAKLVADNVVTGGPLSPAQVLVIVPSEERRGDALATAATLRSRGFNVETYHAADKLKKQLTYGARKRIPYLWFPPFEDGKPHEVKDMGSGEQGPADPSSWSPTAS